MIFLKGTKNIINKEYMRLALRFLKEARLLNYWKKYVDMERNYRFKNRHWSNCEAIDSIFGSTSFTSYFIRKKYNKVCDTPFSIYEIFAYWLVKNGYCGDGIKFSCFVKDRDNKVTYWGRIEQYVTVDIKQKKTTINWKLLANV